MIRLSGIRAFGAAGIVFILVLAVAASGMISGQADPFSEIKEKLSGISEEEKEILKNLFTLTQEIEAMEIEEKRLAEEMEIISREVKDLEKAIAETELDWQKKKESLKQVLKSYQRMGPGSFIEIILDSDSLEAFLQRLNILRDLTRNTGELLDQLEEKGKLLAEEKAGLSLKLSLLEEKQKQSKEAIAEKVKLRTEKEQYLASLKGKEEHYREYLNGIEQVWGEIKAVFSEVVKDFSRIISEGSIPADALKLSISFPDIKGTIEDKTINSIISEQSSLPQIQFAFHEGKVEISLPEKYLVLSGDFVIIDGHALEFQAREGSFYGMPLEPGVIKELLGEGDLVLDLKPLLGGNDIHALEVREGQLELIHRLGLF